MNEFDFDPNKIVLCWISDPETSNNPSLTFEELERLKGRPVWDDLEKEWLLVSHAYTPCRLETQIRSDARVVKLITSRGSVKLIGINCNNLLAAEQFKEGRFYRKQVEE